MAARAVAAAIDRPDDAGYVAYLSALGLLTSPHPHRGIATRRPSWATTSATTRADPTTAATGGRRGCRGDAVPTIIARFRDGDATVQALADEYGVSAPA